MRLWVAVVVALGLLAVVVGGMGDQLPWGQLIKKKGIGSLFFLSISIFLPHLYVVCTYNKMFVKFFVLVLHIVD